MTRCTFFFGVSMKKVLFLSLIYIGSIHGMSVRVGKRLPSMPHAITQTQKQAAIQHRSMKHSLPSLQAIEGSVSSTWKYWSMGLAIGGGVVFAGDAQGEKHRIPWPDMRLSIEKSWYLTDRFTAVIDCSLFTPTLRLGYLLSEQTRLSLGVGIWLLGLYGVYGLKQFSEYIDMLGKGVAMKAQREVGIKNIIKVTPSISLDHFLSSNCFFRLNVSYDRMLIDLNKRHRLTVQWPQLTMGLNFMF